VNLGQGDTVHVGRGGAGGPVPDGASATPPPVTGLRVVRRMALESVELRQNERVVQIDACVEGWGE
jgi:hypothetical protein